MDRNLWENLKAIFFAYRWRYLTAALLVVIGNGLMLLNPLVFREALILMNHKQSSESGNFNHIISSVLGEHQKSLWVWVCILLMLTTGACLFKYYMRKIFWSISRDVERDARSKLFTRIQDQSMAFYDRHNIGELLSRLTNDISAYRDVLGPGIMFPLFFLTLVVPGIVALFYISPTLAPVSIIPLIAIPLVNLSMRKSVYALSYKAQEGLADLSSMAQEYYSGIRIVKGYVAEPQLFKRFGSLCKSLIGINIKLNCFQGILFPFFTLITKIITVLLVLFTALIILKAWSVLSVADFVSFMWIQSYIFLPVLMLAWVLPVYERGRAAYARLVEIYEEPIEVVSKATSDQKISIGADIEFKDLSFSYPLGKKAVLQNFSLHIKGGSFIGITGPVGAGKTTLFRILNREYEISLGKIFIDGREIHEYPLESISKEIVTVEQAPFLFSRTIAENVRFGRSDAMEAEIVAAAEYADLHTAVMEFPEQYETLIGERGVTLSGGQKQRLAIARAYLVDRSIVLFDDVFSAVDKETEMRIFKTMQSNLKGKTVLLITHRVSVLDAMDRVLYMDNGRIIEDGSPVELRKKQGQYAALADLQNLL